MDMNGIALIKGGADSRIERQKHIRERKMRIYRESYNNFLYGYKTPPDMEKAVYYGIKYYAATNVDALDYRQLLIAISDFTDIKNLIAKMSLRQMMNMLPIIKSYDGRKFECKDYYSTMEYINMHDVEELIGIDGVEDFLWNYYNHSIMNFSVNECLVINRIMKHMRQQNLLQSYIDSIGMGDEIHTYSVDSENGTIHDNATGETFKVVKPHNRNEKYFGIIKGGAD